MIMNLSTLTRYFISLGFLFAVYVCYALVMMNDRALPWLNFSYGTLFSICAGCAWGLWNFKTWAWWLSLILATAALSLGGYFVHFAWTFWIFKEPTFFDRVFAVFHPRIFVFMALPLAWLIFFARQSSRRSFHVSF